MLLCLRLPARCAFVQAFDFARALGMNVVRIWAYGDGEKKKQHGAAPATTWDLQRGWLPLA
jgi:hypothetical protein